MYSLILKKNFPVPNASQFKQSLKILSVSQYLQELHNTSYKQDDGVFTSHFSLKKKCPCTLDISQMIQEVPVIILEVENRVIDLNNLEINSLYNASGYILSRIYNTNIICNDCLDSAGSKTYDPNIKFSKLVHLKCYRTKTLFFVNNAKFTYFYEMEAIFRRYIPYFKKVNYDLVTFFINKMSHVECNTLKNYHNISNIIMKRFIRLSLK